MTSPSEQPEPDVLSSTFEKSARAVRHSFKRFETEYARPVAEGFLVESKDHPIRFTFLAIFATLGCLPVLSFLGLALFVYGSSVFIALAAALLFATSVVLFFGFFLAATLAVLFFTALFLTAAALGVYLALRFAVRVRNDGARAGVTEWAQETKEHFLPSSSSSTLGARSAEEEDGDRSEDTIVIGSVLLKEHAPMDSTVFAIGDGEGKGGEPESVADVAVKAEAT